MKTNLLAQNDSLVIENLKADVGRSVENLSHSVTFPIDVDGAILPICCIETLPSDSFEINVEVLLRQISPLKVPVMTNLRLNTAFYYCDNRLAWKKWERFMTGGRSGNEVYDIPRVANISYSPSESVNNKDLVDTYEYDGDSAFNNINYKSTLHTYFGISMNHNIDLRSEVTKDYSNELPIAFPFFDYQIICRDYYTNIDRLPQNPKSGNSFSDYDDLTSDWAYNNLFPSNDDEIRLVDGAQMRSGFQSGDDSSEGKKGFLLDKVRYHDVRPDYFTTSKKAPMRGDAPELSSVTTQNVILPSGTEIKFKNKEGEHLINGQTQEVFTNWSGTTETYYTKSLAINTHGIGNTAYAYAGDSGDNNWHNLKVSTTPVDNVTGLINGDIVAELDLSLGITAAELRLISQLTVWQELNMLHEPYYNDFLNAHFDNVRVGESPVEKPIYIGGTSQVISINEILQTSQSTTGESGSPLGNQGATAMSLASNRVGTYYSNNYGYIIGVAYIIPDMMYKPAMPRGFSRRTKEDYYSPEFANLSMQATLNKEIYFSNDDDWNNAPWGYTGAFDELRSIPNRIAGDLLNSSYSDLQKWVLVREMANDNLPAMESTWLSLKGNVDKTAWSVKTMPAFMLQCANYIKAVRPMPKVAIPKAL